MFEPFDGTAPRVDATAFVHEAATLIGDVVVGPGSSVWPGAVLRGDDGPIVVGGWTSIQDGCILHGTVGLSETRVGQRVTVGHGAILHGCVVEDDVIVGMGSILLDNARIGSGTILGAGTLVPMNKEVPPGVLVMGNPFKVVRELGDRDRQWIELSWRSYVERLGRYRSARGTPLPR